MSILHFFAVFFKPKLFCCHFSLWHCTEHHKNIFCSISISLSRCSESIIAKLTSLRCATLCRVVLLNHTLPLKIVVFFWISLFAFEMKTVRRRRWGQPQMTQTFCHCRRPNDILSHNQIPNDSCSDNFAFLHKNITWRNRSSSLHTSNRLLKSGFNLILTGKERFWTRSTFNIQRKI